MTDVDDMQVLVNVGQFGARACCEADRVMRVIDQRSEEHAICKRPQLHALKLQRFLGTPSTFQHHHRHHHQPHPKDCLPVRRELLSAAAV